MALKIMLSLIGEIAIMWKSLEDVLKYLTKSFGSLTLCETSMAHFTFDFLVMGFFLSQNVTTFLPWLRTDPAGAG